MLGAVGDHRGLVQVLPGLDHHHRCHRLHPLGVRQANHRHFAHLRQAVNHFFDLAAGHVFAAGLDHVLLAVHHRDIALLVEGAQISAVEPVALKRRLGALVVVVIAQHQMWRAVHDLADLAHGHILHVVVHHAGFDVAHRLAARTQFAQLILWAEQGGQRGDFSLAVQIP